MNLIDHDPFLGLICGFTFEGGRARRLHWNEMVGAITRRDCGVWLHLNTADQRSQHFIAESEAIQLLVREFLLARDERARLEPLAGGIAGVLPDIRLQSDEDSFEAGIIRLFCDGRLLISVRNRPVRTMDRLRLSVEQGAVEGGAPDVFVRLMREFDVTFSQMIDGLAVNLDRVEDLILAARIEDGARDLGQLRRGLVALRRQVSPHRHAVGALLARLPPWVDDDESAELRQLHERHVAHHQEIEHMQESARLLQDELASRQSELTNRNLYFLSIATAIFLPMTLVTGIFGMNVAGLPGLKTSAAFWLVMLALAATGLTSLIILRLRRLI
jgi:zinc transporter